MIQINEKSKLVKIWEFLTGNYRESWKPQTLCALFWNLVLVTILFPILLPWAIFINTMKMEDAIWVPFSERLKQLLMLFIGYLMFTFIGIQLANNYTFLQFENIGFWGLIILPIAGLLGLLAIALAGATLTGIILGIRYLIVDLLINKLMKPSEDSEWTYNSDMKRSEWISTLKSKMCPMINWKREKESDESDT